MEELKRNTANGVRTEFVEMPTAYRHALITVLIDFSDEGLKKTKEFADLLKYTIGTFNFLEWDDNCLYLYFTPSQVFLEEVNDLLRDYEKYCKVFHVTYACLEGQFTTMNEVDKMSLNVISD